MKLIKSFDSLPQRIFYNYGLCLSPFTPIKSDVATETEQAQMHRLCGDIIKTLSEKPDLMKITNEPDDSFELYVCNNRKPELSKSFRKSAEIMANLYRFMCLAALNGTISGVTLTAEYDKKQKDVKMILSFLSFLGIAGTVDGTSVTLKSAEYPGIFSAMRLLATVSARGDKITDESLFSFAMCLFNQNQDYLVDMIEREMELEKGFFAPYFEKMIKMGYIAKHKYGWCPEGPYFNFNFLNDVSGVRLIFDMRKVHQIYFDLGSTIGSKAICEDFGGLDDDIRKYIFGTIGGCSNCLGCTKGGKNAKFSVEIEYGGEKRMICPQFYSIQVPNMNHDIINAMIEYSALQARYGKNWHKAKK